MRQVETPNPDVLCNREIKFDLFLKAAMKLGADYVATGHYVRKMEDEKGFHLLSGKDPNKDQSYFLCQVTEEQISKALFPIGELLKPNVRKIAERRQDCQRPIKRISQGLCFIGKVSLPDFLQQQLKPKKGETVLIERDWMGYSLKEKSVEGMTRRFHYKKEDGESSWRA